MVTYVNLEGMTPGQGVAIYGNSEAAQIGYSVSSAGDFNRDGIEDFIFTGPVTDAVNAGRGVTYLIFGNASGIGPIDLSTLSPAQGFAIYGDAAGFNSDKGVDMVSAGAGDINGDGYDDIVIGAPRNSIDGTWTGRAYIVYGHGGPGSTIDLGTMNASQGVTILSGGAGAFTGVSVAGVGDVNSDGYDDFLIGAESTTNGGAVYAGSVFLVYGRPGGVGSVTGQLNLAALQFYQGVTFNNTTAGEFLGQDVSGIGDINGDGVDDFAIVGGGDVVVRFGVPVGGVPGGLNPSDTQGFIIPGGGELGLVSGAGDVNGDGYDDLLVGKRGTGEGTPYLIWGKAGGFGTIDLDAITPSQGIAIDRSPVSGWIGALSAAGDVNGDGFDDFVIGVGSGTQGGDYVVFGSATLNSVTLGTSDGMVLTTGNFDDGVGRSFGAADVNHDGFTDLLAGAWRSNVATYAAGATYLIYGERPTGPVVRTGSAGGQSIAGGDDDDELNGLAGDDHLHGNGGADTLNGGVDDDILDGGTGGDTMDGGPGDDVFIVDNAGDFVFEAPFEGNDRVLASVSWTMTEDQEIETLVTSDAAGNGAIDFTGNGYANRIEGNAGINLLAGAGGNDTLFGFGGNDQLDGGADDDALDGGAGDDTLTGGEGADTLDGGAGKDNVSGGGGNDTLYANDEEDFVAGETYDGGSGYDTLFIDAFDPADPNGGWSLVDLTGITLTGIERLAGTANTGGPIVKLTRAQLTDFKSIEAGRIYVADTGTLALAGVAIQSTSFLLTTGDDTFDLTGVRGANGAVQRYFVNGDTGNDRIFGGVGDDGLIGGNGIDLLYGGAGKDYLQGDAGNDQLYGSADDDQIYGGAGNDTLDGGIGADWMDGGANDDSYTVDNALDRVIETANAGIDTVRTTLASYTLGDNVERLSFGGTGAFAGTGNDLANILDTRTASGNDTLRGMGGADTLYAGAGNDSLDGGAGTDAMHGGMGDDSYVVDDAADQVVEVSGEGTDIVRSSALSYTLGSNVENLTLIGAGKNGTGNALANVLIGNDGHNSLDGKAGADRMEGGGGADTYFVDNANDLIIESGVGIDNIIASASYTLRAGVAVETMTTDNDLGTALIDLTGNELANRIVGNAAANTLRGGAGDDRLEGLGGSDTLWGNSGADLLMGGDGNDLYVVTDLSDSIVETATGGVDWVSLSLATGGVFTLANYLETLIVAGTATEAHGNSLDNKIVNSGTGNSLWGEGGNDQLIGATVADQLHGGAGNDRIAGGTGNDRLWGDAGNDVFAFATGDGADEVVDFVRGADRIDLTACGVSSFAQLQGMLSQSGANAVIDLGGGNTITLDNIVSSQLAASDFVYAAAPPSLMATMVDDVQFPSGEFLSGGPARVSVLDL